MRHRFFNYIVVSDQEKNTLVQKRTDKGIWRNLYEFPLIESEKEEGFENISEQIRHRFEHWNILSISEEETKNSVHKLSHQHLHIQFWTVTVAGIIENGISKTDLKTFPFPIVLHNFIEAN